ncbi:MAG: hypothetical protein M3154_04545 [Candidatus Eremiobacteraeota bacterium]|nr:hypothetical protein [Candidatus Eremiobacteraeota bacterium]
MTVYRAPTEQERTLLRIVTLGYPELEAQIECCEVAEYDPPGYCDVHVLSGPPCPGPDHCDGPSLSIKIPMIAYIETILWIDERGMLANIEFVSYMGPADGVYEAFIRGAADGTLVYKKDD